MSDLLRKIDFRSPYRPCESRRIPESELTEETSEVCEVAPAITNATGSPYLSDQNFQLKQVLFNSPAETEWKEVKSFEQTRNISAFTNLKKLNIL
jgi:hypothetical protein